MKFSFYLILSLLALFPVVNACEWHDSGSFSQRYSNQGGFLLANYYAKKRKKECVEECNESSTPCLQGANSSDARKACYEQLESCKEHCE
ncbi:MAG: hypothetical protein AAGB12_02200 [Pseudomonadota bacterium]